jgi:hypothetical protein
MGGLRLEGLSITDGVFGFIIFCPSKTGARGTMATGANLMSGRSTCPVKDGLGRCKTVELFAIVF